MGGECYCWPRTDLLSLHPFSPASHPNLAHQAANHPKYTIRTINLESNHLIYPKKRKTSASKEYRTSRAWQGHPSLLTMTTESLAETAKMSAHDTTPGHAFSTAVFILSMTSNPLAEFRLGFAVFSPVKLDVSSNSNEPSHP